MRQARFGVLWLMGLTAAGGCYTAARKTDSPVLAQEGFRVALLGVDCFDGQGTSLATDHDLDVQLQIDNPTRSILKLSTGKVQLAVGDYRANPALSETYLVQRNESLSVHLHFAHPATCADSFALDFAHAFSVERRLIALGELHLVPR